MDALIHVAAVLNSPYTRVGRPQGRFSGSSTVKAARSVGSALAGTCEAVVGLDGAATLGLQAVSRLAFAVISTAFLTPVIGRLAVVGRPLVPRASEPEVPPASVAEAPAPGYPGDHEEAQRAASAVRLARTIRAGKEDAKVPSTSGR